MTASILHLLSLLVFLPSLKGADRYLRPLYINQQDNPKCYPIPYQVCQGMQYNLTAMPNLVGIELQAEAEYSLGTFKPLIKFGCSSQLQFLLCSLYAPMCTPGISNLIGPCRGVCKDVRDRCAPVLRGFGLPWPSALNCSKLPPQNNEKHMCMEGPGETVPLPSTPSLPPPPHPLSRCSHLARPQLYTFVGTYGRCAPLCHAHILFTTEDKSFALVWMSLWSVVTFIIGGVAAGSLLLKKSMFKYPERAAINICLSYALVALGYIVRLSLGSQTVSCWRDPEVGISVAVSPGVLTSPCVLVFLLLYFFAISAGVWWLILCSLWVAKAWKSIGHEHVLPHSAVLHALGWGTAAALTIPCLLYRRVEADELTGTCFAGGHNLETLVRWVIIPNFLFIVIGATLVMVAFACMWKSREEIRKSLGPDRAQFKGRCQKIEIEAARIGVISVMFMVPAMCMLGVTFYEFRNRNTWLVTGSRPSVEAFMLRIFMAMCPGLLISLFLINSQALEEWKNFWYKLKGKRPVVREPYVRGTLVNGKESLKVHIPERMMFDCSQDMWAHDVGQACGTHKSKTKHVMV